MTIDANTVTCHVLPSDAAARLEATGQRRQAVIASRIQAARAYAETVHCRRAELLAYFGDYFDPPCGNCDNDRAAGAKDHVARTEAADRGRRVRHRLWGEGTLLHHDDHELIVVFDSVGYRTLTPAALTNGLLTELGPG